MTRPARRAAARETDDRARIVIGVRVAFSELLDDGRAVRPLLARLAAARLVTVDADTVQVAHEALIRSWPRPRGWLAEDRELLRAHRRLTEAAAEWRDHGFDETLPYRGPRLAAWQGRDRDRLNDLEREFLNEIEFGPDGGTLVSGHDDGTVRVWRCAAFGG